MKIVEINDYRDFLSLKESWTEVLQNCEHTVFSTWEWLSVYWKYFGKGKMLLILLAEEENEIIGIAPLMYSVTTRGGLRRGKIEFMGVPGSDYNTFLLTQRKKECVHLFINHLLKLRYKWDCIDLTDIRHNDESLTLLSKLAKIVPVNQCSYIFLPNSQDEFLKALGHSQRHNLLRNLKRLEKSGFTIDFVDYSSNQLFEKGMNIFFELHQKRWVSKGFLGVYAEDRVRHFGMEIAKIFSEKGWLGLHILELSGTPVSALYGFKYHSTYYGYLSGFDPAFHRYSVGNLIFAHVFERCIQDGLTVFDFMRGGDQYKSRWNAIPCWNYQAVLTKRGLVPNFQHWFCDKYWHQWNRLKYFLTVRKH